jgi:hypothetical protein
MTPDDVAQLLKQLHKIKIALFGIFLAIVTLQISITVKSIPAAPQPPDPSPSLAAIQQELAQLRQTVSQQPTPPIVLPKNDKK